MSNSAKKHSTLSRINAMARWFGQIADQFPLISYILLATSMLGISSCSQLAYVDPDPVKPHTHIQPQANNTPAPPLAPPRLRLDTLLNNQVNNPLSRRYTLSFKNTPVKTALYVLARKTGLQLDIRDLPRKRITLYLKDVPLHIILDRISEQAGIRYTLKDNVLTLEKDTPYWKSYKVDYVNIDSTYSSASEVALQLGTGNDNQGGQENGQNNIMASTNGENRFWTRLQNAISTIITPPNMTATNTSTHATNNTTAAAPQTQPTSAQQGSSGNGVSNTTQANSSTNVFINREAGILLAYATAQQHKKIQQLINTITTRAKKQVLIEATVIEVDLSENNKMGIDWSNFKLSFGGASTGSAQAAVVYDSTKPYLVDNFTFNMGIKFLKQFGNVKVLSTPKIMALNNQTAILKVVNNHVYFTTEIDTQTTQGTSTTNVTTTLHSVPIGFVMGVTPFVGSDGDITLQVKPTISRIVGYAKDPNPTLAQAGTESLIPIVQEKEMSTILRLRDQQIAILGGLMRDEISNSETGFPMGRVGQFINEVAGYHEGTKSKTELIIFLRPTVVNNPAGDPFDSIASKYKYMLPAASAPQKENKK